MIRIFAIFIFLGLQLFAQTKVVFDLTTPRLATFEARLIAAIKHTKEYYTKQNEDLQIRVIVHGDAYKFFLKEYKNTLYAKDKELQKISKSLEKELENLVHSYDVEFLLCEVGATKRELKKEQFFPFVSMVPSAIIALIEAQKEGYSFILID